MVETVPSWTDERVDLLRRLWEEGLSASVVAAQLGGVTRNAVIGKVHRLGLSGRVKAADAAAARAKGASPREDDVAAEAVVATVEPTPITAHRPAPSFPAPAAPAALDTTPLRASTRVTIMDLRESMCRWPVGDPTSPDFHYCGDRSITGLPYCAHHCQIAYQPAAERKRDRRVGGFR